MRFSISLSAVLIACMVRVTHNLDCEQNQNGQSMSFFKTNGDLLLTGKLIVQNILNCAHVSNLTFSRFLRRLRREMFGPHFNRYPFNGNGSHRCTNTKFDSLHPRHYIGYVKKI